MMFWIEPSWPKRAWLRVARATRMTDLVNMMIVEEMNAVQAVVERLLNNIQTASRDEKERQKRRRSNRSVVGKSVKPGWREKG